MMQFFKRILGFAEPDLGRILASFRKTLTKLDAHVTHPLDAAQTQDAVAEAAVHARDFHEAQAGKAKIVFANISKLVGAS